MAEDNGQRTEIGPDTVINGTIRAEAELLIFGKVIGDILSTDTVIIEDGGFVEGTIDAPWVGVSGAVAGDIVARERLEILETGRIIGEIRAQNIAMVEGAAVSGRVVVGEDFDSEPGPKVSKTQTSRSAAPKGKGRGEVTTRTKNTASSKVQRTRPVQSDLIQDDTEGLSDED